MSGTSSRRATPRSNFAPVMPTSHLGSGLTPSLKKEGQSDDPTSKFVDERLDDGAYSDPDEGVEIVDIDDVRRMDWMAPESLRKERQTKTKRNIRVKKEEVRKGKGIVKGHLYSFSGVLKLKRIPAEEPTDNPLMDIDDGEEDQVNLANALDLSESEEEEQMEDLIHDFALQEPVADPVSCL